MMIATPLISSFLLALLLCPLLAKLAPRLGLMDDPDQPRKIHSTSIPLVGGLAVWIAITVALFLIQRPVQWHLWVGITAMGFVGLLDDWIEFSALPKFLCQVLVAVFLWYFGTRITLFVPSQIVSLILTVCWFVWVTNALNYLDNSNGLCGGIGVITLAGLLVVHFFFQGHTLSFTGNFAAIALCAIAGFLFWNFPRARVFLGDSGSHLIGALIATLMMQTTFVKVAEGQSHWAILAILLFILIPLVDFIQVSVSRLRRGQSIWKGDANHLSHLLIRKGWTPAGAVMILWVATIASIVAAIVFWQMSL